MFTRQPDTFDFPAFILTSSPHKQSRSPTRNYHLIHINLNVLKYINSPNDVKVVVKVLKLF